MSGNDIEELDSQLIGGRNVRDTRVVQGLEFADRLVYAPRPRE